MHAKKKTKQELEEELTNLRTRLEQLLQEQGKLQSLNEELRITEEELRTQTEELIASRTELEQTRAQYRDLFESAPDGYIVTDAAGVIKNANEAVSLILGRSAAELVKGKYRLSHFIPDISRFGDFRQLTASVKKPKPPARWETQIVSGGKPHWVAISSDASFSPSGAVTEIRWLIRDISRRKQAESELLESERRLGHALETVQTGAWEMDLETHRAERSPLHDRIFGYQTMLPSWTYEMFVEHVLPEDRAEVDRRYRRAIENNRDWNFECRIRRADGAVRWIKAAGRHLIGGAGASRRLAGVVQDITDQRLAEEQLRLSEEKYAKAFAINPAAIVMTRLKDGIIIEANDTCRTMFGYSKEEAIGQASTDLNFWPKLGHRTQFIEELLKKGSIRNSEQTVLRKSGESFEALVSAEVLTIAGEDVILTTWLDISERKKAEAEVERIAQHRQLALDAAQLGWWQHDVATGLGSEDQRCAEILGLAGTGHSEEEFLRHIHPDDLAAVREKFEAACNPADPKPYFAEYRMLLPDGSVRWIESHGIASFEGSGSQKRAVSLTGTVRDVTERKNAQEIAARRQSNLVFLAGLGKEFLRLRTGKEIVESIGRQLGEYLGIDRFILAEMDPELKHATVEYNWRSSLDIPDMAGVHRIAAFETGAIQETLVAGDTVVVCNTQDDRRMDSATNAAFGIYSGIGVPYRQSDRLSFVVVTDSKPRAWHPEDAELIRYVTERTIPRLERARAEEALQNANAYLERRVQERTAELNLRARQLRALAGELTISEQRERRRLAKVLHDHLQQLLVGAKFRLAVLGRGEDDLVKRAIKEIEDLIDESIASSRSLTAELSPPILHEAGLRAGLEWLARRMANRQGLFVNLELEEAEGLPDDLKILVFECVRELLFNVAKHAQTRSADVSLRRVEGHIQITVSDQGVGFDPDAIRAGEQGRGFGLFSIRERLELVGGRFEVQSVPGQGSRICISVPAAQEAVATKPESAANAESSSMPKSIVAEVPSRKIRVLLVDDHAVVREGIANLISDEPDIVVVGTAADGQEAIHAASQLLPDVILMDMNMPKLNGVEAAKVIHGEYPEVRIIGLSMFEEAERAQAMREAGAVNYLTKSGPAEDLISAIRTSIRRPKATTRAIRD